MKAKSFLFPALIAVIGIVLLFVLIPKIWGILVILLALAYGFVKYSQLKHPEKSEDIAEKAALFRDRFHRVRHQNGNN